jgi:hypothetical protein
MSTGRSSEANSKGRVGGPAPFRFQAGKWD